MYMLLCYIMLYLRARGHLERLRTPKDPSSPLLTPYSRIHIGMTPFDPPPASVSAHLPTLPQP